MRSALYYPFTDPKQESFLKTALFLWTPSTLSCLTVIFVRMAVQMNQ